MNDAANHGPSVIQSRQTEIYLAGLQGQLPATPVGYADLVARAEQVLSPAAFGYIAGGAGGESTMRANRAAFDRWQIMPRMLRDISERDLSVRVLDQSFDYPVMLAPIGVQSVAHPEAELAVARAARALGVPMILSTVSSFTMEQVAEALGPTLRWFQLYWGRDPEVTASFLARAEQAGYSALVITLDTNILAWRPRDIQQAYLPFLRGEGLANFFSDPAFRASLPEPPEQNPQAAIMQWVRVGTNPTLTWPDLAFIRAHTRLPILLKGILHPDDARRALEHGASGVIVSNHGGRQVDGAIGALDALPAVVAAIGDRAPVLFDSGLRDGADAIKALALGARMVLLGRPYMWGLAVGGTDGARDVIHNFLADLDLNLALSGHTRIAQLGRASLTRTHGEPPIEY